MIEGRGEEELPECVLGAAQIKRLDMDQLDKIDIRRLSFDDLCIEDPASEEECSPVDPAVFASTAPLPPTSPL